MKTRIVRNTVFNIFGSIIPIVASLITIPFIIEGFGIDRYGILAIVFIVAGYFGLFDLGLGRATTRFMSKAWHQHNQESAASYFWLTFGVNFGLGVLGGICLALLAPWLIIGLLKIPLALKEEALLGFYWLSLSIPLYTTVSSLIGALESHHRFGLINSVQITVDLFIRCAPLAVLPFTNRLDKIVEFFFIIRLFSFLIYLFLCLYKIPALRKHRVIKKDQFLNLFNFGGWLTITNIIGPLMTYIDRFFIGSAISMRAVTFYTVPYDLLRKLQIVPLGVSRTLFPIFGSGDIEQTGSLYANLYEQSIKYLIILLVPIFVCITILAEYILNFWLGHEFATSSSMIMRILAVGAFINALAKPPYVFIQGIGRPDITAKFHLLEFPFYLLMLFCFIHWFGIVGVAIAWTIRVIADTSLLHHWATRFINTSMNTSFSNRLAVSGISALITITISLLLSSLNSIKLQLCGTIILILMFLFWSWFVLLNNDDRLYFRNMSSNFIMNRT